MEWSADQERVLREINAYRRAPDKPLFTVAGPFGTGKSTLIAKLVGGDSSVAVMTPTGKSAEVLRRKGVKANTIHHTLLRPAADLSGQQCKLCGRDFHDGDEAFYGPISGKVLRYVGTCCRAKLDRARPLDTDDIRFIKRDSIEGDPRLFVLDEGSMIGSTLFPLILSFGFPTVMFADPFQIPPPRDEGGSYLEKPDAELTSMHRQALDNPIIWMATRVREGHWLRYGSYGGVPWSRDEKACTRAIS